MNKPLTIADQAESKRLEILRRIGPIGRLNAAFGLYEFAREHLIANLRKQHPEWTEQ